MTTNVDPHETSPATPPVALEHVTVEHDDAPNECALYPRGATQERLMTTWIAAHGDAFVSLESMR